MRLILASLILISLTSLSVMSAKAQKPELVVQSGHHQTVHALAVSPDKRLLASAGGDRVIIIWDLVHGQQLYSLRGHSQWIFSLAFSPNGKLLASGSADGTAVIWDVARGTKEAEISLQPYGVSCVAFNPDGETLAISGKDKVITLWDVPNRRIKVVLRGHAGEVAGVAFSPDNKYLASVSHDRTLRRWDLGKMAVDRMTRFDDHYIPGHLSLSFSPDGSMIAFGLEGSVFFWYPETGQSKARPFPETKGKTSVEGFVFLSNQELACILNDQIHSWNFEANKIAVIAESPSGLGSAITISSDRTLVVFGHDDDIDVLDLATRHIQALKGGYESFQNVLFMQNGTTLVARGSSSFVFGDFDFVGQKEAGSLAARLLGVRHAYVPAIKEIVTFGEIEGGYGSPNIEILKDPKNRKDNPIVKAHAKSIDSISVNPAGTILASCSKDGTIKLWDVTNWQAPIKVIPEFAETVRFSPDGKFLVSDSYEEDAHQPDQRDKANSQNKDGEDSKGDSEKEDDSKHKDNKLKLWDTRRWMNRVIATGQFGQILFSPDSKMIASVVHFGLHTELRIWDVKTGLLLSSMKLDELPSEYKIEDFVAQLPYPIESLKLVLLEFSSHESPGSLSFSPDSRWLAHQYTEMKTGIQTIKVWDVKTGKELQNFNGHTSTVRSTAFSPNGAVLASGSLDTTIKLWDARRGEELATIIPLNEDKWVIYTADGRFDTNTDPEDDEVLHWSVTGKALTTLPVDVFMRDYSEPKLFERLLECSNRGSCRTDFKHLRDLSELNLVRPKVTITNVSLPNEDGQVEITVEVSSGSEQVEQAGGRTTTRTSGVYDLRVFRDRQLVGVAPADGAEKLWRVGAGSGNSELELPVWRQASEVKLDPQTGKQTLSFKARLPQAKDNSAIKFTAYAFNDDRVKSATATYEWSADQKAQLPKVQANHRHRAYVVSVGVSMSHLAKWNLNHGADDARQFQSVIPEKLKGVGAYDVVPIELVSDLQDGKLLDNATKQNIKTVLDLLAGREVSIEDRKRIPAFQQLRAAQPDDFVLVTFSGHGYSAKSGDFYLFPADISTRDPNQTIPDLPSLISGEELSIWLREVDAGEIAIIIDACQSAGAVEGLAFKPGPLGSRGLGQLAYDKRMMILAATQASNDALEVDGKISQGLLSYALAREGFTNADDVEDGKLTLRKWLKFGERRVPYLYLDVIEGKIRGVVSKRNGKRVTRGKGAATSVQRPLLFDFSRQNGEIVMANVEPATKKP